MLYDITTWEGFISRRDGAEVFVNNGLNHIVNVDRVGRVWFFLSKLQVENFFHPT